MELWLVSGLVAMACFVIAAIASRRPKADPTKPKLVVASAGCLGCLMTVSVIVGVLSSIVSLVASVKKLME